MERSSLVICRPGFEEEEQSVNGCVVFDSCAMQKKSKIPEEFIWPLSERPNTQNEELDAPVVDLGGFPSGDEESTRSAAGLVAAACKVHGFFQVINHGVDPGLISRAVDCLDAFFKLPLKQKMKAKQVKGSVWGYAGAHSGRFTSKLPWKETLSFGYNHSGSGVGGAASATVVHYFTSIFGKDFEPMGWVYQTYCEAMKKLSLTIMELLGVSLGLGRSHYREFFEDGSSIMRCNYYPACPEPELTMGTGPHCDPTALTVLNQDLVGGLEVFSGGRWRVVRPVGGALVVNIGDTFMALSNGRYKSCLHRAMVNRNRERRSIAFFLCPRDNELLRPPENLVGVGSGATSGDRRKYPDFTWSELMEFTQKHYRADTRTLQSFSEWLLSSHGRPQNMV